MDGKIFADTCALADEVTPVIYGLGLLNNAVILKSVSLEIKKLCTSPDKNKQCVGQQAALTVMTLHSLPSVEVIMDTDEPTVHHPDDDLINRALLSKGRVFTADTKLQRKAREQQIEIIAVQQYRELLRIVTPKLTELFPSEQNLIAGTITTVHIAKLGNKPGQGVGFLPDRRMVVIEDSESYLGGNLQVEVTSIHRSDSGQEIIFAVPAEVKQKTE